jgi:RNA polymerase sigma-70 factor, ECF subfamily
MPSPRGGSPSRPEPSPLESTAVLLEQARSGDAAARERLFARYLPALRRWAHRRLPAGARDLHETDDLVQVTLIRALANLATFENRGEGAFLAYLRQILVNAVRDEIRRAMRRRAPVPLDDALPDPGPSALEHALGRETLERYERALAALNDEQREAVILKVELGFSLAQIAEALGKPSPDAARMTVARALLKLAEVMHERD